MAGLVSISRKEFKKRFPRLNISYGMHNTRFGNCLVGISEEGICHVSFQDDVNTGVKTLQDEWPKAQLTQNQNGTQQIVQKIFDGEQDMKLFTVGTEFQNKVWQTLLQIPIGTTTSYENVAALIGKPTAVRAVANAISKNRIGYLVPCHRVISKSGKIHKYRWGGERKKKMLDYEANSPTNVGMNFETSTNINYTN